MLCKFTTNTRFDYIEFIFVSHRMSEVGLVTKFVISHLDLLRLGIFVLNQTWTIGLLHRASISDLLATSLRNTMNI